MQKVRSDNQSVAPITGHDALSALLEAIGQPLVILDPEGSLIRANTAFGLLFGAHSDDLVGKSLPNFGKWLWTDELRQAVAMCNGTGEGFEDLSVSSYVVTGTYLGSMTAGTTGILLSLREETGNDAQLRHDLERRVLEGEETIQRQSSYDSLTNLPNRSMLEGRLTQAILTAQDRDETIAVLFLDLDRFKTINDALGHGAGDDIIRQIAERLRIFEREEDLVARFGADEFLVVLHGLKGRAELKESIGRVRDIFKEPFVSRSKEIHLNVSIGVSVFPEDGGSAEELVKRADAALYRAKEVGGDTYRFYNPALFARAEHYLALENELRRALDRGQMSMAYQPIVDTATGRVLYAEALMRWEHPKLGMVFPSEFIPLAEQTGLITRLGEWAIATVCDQIAVWRNKGLSLRSVAVNISPRQFVQSDFDERLALLILDKKVAPGSLQLEITESMAMHNLESTVHRLERFKKLGVQISIDDFGMGHSSLGYLRQLPVDKLKVDKSFVKSCTEDERDAAIVKAIVTLGKTLGFGICAEGVETVGQLDLLRDLGCDTVQGFYFSKPLPALEFESWMSRLQSS